MRVGRSPGCVPKSKKTIISRGTGVGRSKQNPVRVWSRLPHPNQCYAGTPWGRGRSRGGGCGLRGPSLSRWIRVGLLPPEQPPQIGSLSTQSAALGGSVTAPPTALRYHSQRWAGRVGILLGPRISEKDAPSSSHSPTSGSAGPPTSAPVCPAGCPSRALSSPASWAAPSTCCFRSCKPLLAMAAVGSARSPRVAATTLDPAHSIATRAAALVFKAPQGWPAPRGAGGEGGRGADPSTQALG